MVVLVSALLTFVLFLLIFCTVFAFFVVVFLFGASVMVWLLYVFIVLQDLNYIGYSMVSHAVIMIARLIGFSLDRSFCDRLRLPVFCLVVLVFVACSFPSVFSCFFVFFLVSLPLSLSLSLSPSASACCK